MRPVAFELSQRIEAGHAIKRNSDYPKKALGLKGKSEFNERGTSDEDNNEI
jgi:hypothetical protein